jgi:hypothetical protein
MQRGGPTPPAFGEPVSVMRSRFAFLWVLATALIAGIAAYIAYGAGVATHITGTAVADGAVYYHPFFGFGFFFPILVIVLLFLAFRPRRWGRGGWGGYGMRGGFQHGGVPPQIEQRLQEWHRGAHGETSPPPTPGAPTGGEQTGV